MSDYTTLLNSILQQYSTEEIEQICKNLNRIYNIYDSEDHRWSQIKYAFTKTDEEVIDQLRKSQISNRVINDLILRFYPCERVIKYYLIQKLLHLSNHIVAFEMSVGHSRIDLCRINGHSYAYEIKTKYDTFERLETQLIDYTETFEKVYIVIPIERKIEAFQCIPNNCGIITYRISPNGKVFFSYCRKAINNSCSVKKCAESLSSSELLHMLKVLNSKIIPSTKDERIEQLCTYSDNIFLPTYKKFLKGKYISKWNFLVQHFSEILPIDIQSFFSSSLDPSLAYYIKKMDSHH